MEIIRKHFVTIDSTNNWAKKNVDLLDSKKMTVITAEEQTAGRGRFKRRWESPANQNLYVSLCFFLAALRPDSGNIAQVAGISVVQTLDEMGFEAFLKWPNDVMVSDKKIAGILSETTTCNEGLYFIFGIGLNINMPQASLAMIDRPATSLLHEKGIVFSVEEVLAKLLHNWNKNIELFLSQGFSPFLNFYRERMWRRENLIRFHDNLNIWEGRFHSIDQEGALNLELLSGEIKKFIAGEIL